MFREIVIASFLALVVTSTAHAQSSIFLNDPDSSIEEEDYAASIHYFGGLIIIDICLASWGAYERCIGQDSGGGVPGVDGETGSTKCWNRYRYQLQGCTDIGLENPF